MMCIAFLGSTFWAIAGAIGGGLLSFVLGLLLEKYKNRRLEIKYNITYQKIGIPSDSYLPGELNVTYEGSQVDSLYFFRLEIVNNSNFDAKDIPIQFFSDLNSLIYSYSYAWIPNTTAVTTNTEYTNRLINHNEVVASVLGDDPNALIPEPHRSEGLWLHRNRQLILNSLNRKERVEFTVLIGSSTRDHLASLYLTVPKSGVILTLDKDPLAENEKVGKYSIVMGFILTVTLGIILAFFNRDVATPLIILSIIGGLSFLFGIAIYKTANFFYSYFR